MPKNVGDGIPGIPAGPFVKETQFIKTKRIISLNPIVTIAK